MLLPLLTFGTRQASTATIVSKLKLWQMPKVSTMVWELGRLSSSSSSSAVLRYEVLIILASSVTSGLGSGLHHGVGDH